jgi:hypothetical protein
MIAGITLEAACELVGHWGGTKAREIARALHKTGIRCAEKRIKIKRPGTWPVNCVLSLSPKGAKNWHWVVCIDGEVYDPDGHGLAYYLIGGWRVTSYLPVFF